MKASKETIIRTIVLLIALVNQVLTILGKNPLPFSNEAVYEGVSAVFTVVASVWTWWKNNSFSTAAIMADDYLKQLRGGDRK